MQNVRKIAPSVTKVSSACVQQFKETTHVCLSLRSDTDQFPVDVSYHEISQITEGTVQTDAPTHYRDLTDKLAKNLVISNLKLFMCEMHWPNSVLHS